MIKTKGGIFLFLAILLVVGNGCAAWTAEKYGSHGKYNFEIPFVASDSGSKVSQKIAADAGATSSGDSDKVNEVTIVAKGAKGKGNLCEARARKTPRVEGRKYVSVGSNPVDPNRYYDPGKEILFYLPKDMFLRVESGKSRRASSVWTEEGTVGVADKATGRAVRICKCGNGILDEIFVQVNHQGGAK